MLLRGEQQRTPTLLFLLCVIVPIQVVIIPLLTVVLLGFRHHSRDECLQLITKMAPSVSLKNLKPSMTQVSLQGLIPLKSWVGSPLGYGIGRAIGTVDIKNAKAE